MRNLKIRIEKMEAQLALQPSPLDRILAEASEDEIFDMLVEEFAHELRNELKRDPTAAEVIDLYQNKMAMVNSGPSETIVTESIEAALERVRKKQVEKYQFERKCQADWIRSREKREPSEEEVTAAVEIVRKSNEDARRARGWEDPEVRIQFD